MRIRVIADVKPRPSIKTARVDTAYVVGRMIFADFIPLVRAHPKLVAARTKCDSYRVADSPCVNFSISPIRIELVNARAIGFRTAIGNIRARTDGDVHLFAVR